MRRAYTMKGFSGVLIFIVVIYVIFFSDYTQEIVEVNKTSSYTTMFTTKEKGITDNEAMLITEEVIESHKHLILQDLGVMDDGILDRIYIVDGYPQSGFDGFCYEKHTITNGIMTYVQGSAYIELYPLRILYSYNEVGELVPIDEHHRISKEQFREHMTKILAHELRHYWQYQTGFDAQYPDQQSLPYEERPSEIDAYAYMDEYYESFQSK